MKERRDSTHTRDSHEHGPDLEADARRCYDALPAFEVRVLQECPELFETARLSIESFLTEALGMASLSPLRCFMVAGLVATLADFLEGEDGVRRLTRQEFDVEMSVRKKILDNLVKHLPSSN